MLLSSSSLVTTELFQRVRGSRPEILDQKRSPDSSVRGKNITLLPSISSSPEESFVLFCFVVGIDNRLSSPANSLLRYIALHRRDLHSLTRRHLSKVCRKRQVHAFLPVEESRTEYSGKNSFSLSLLGSVCIFYVDTFFFFVLPFVTQLTMNDFSVHRIIGRGGFGEVYGCRKADTGKMYAMKCLDKKRIKMKQGETLALNERIMLSLVSTGVSGYRLSSFHPVVLFSFLLLKNLVAFIYLFIYFFTSLLIVLLPERKIGKGKWSR